MDLARRQISDWKVSKIFAWFLILTLTVLCINYMDLIFAKVRDIKRKIDIKQLQTALAIYQNKFNELPESIDYDFGAWDSSLEPQKHSAKEFLNILLQEKIVDKKIKDPLNYEDYYYLYQQFPAGSYGCEKPFAILQIKNFELSTKDHGNGSCPKKNFMTNAPNGYTLQIFE